MPPRTRNRILRLLLIGALIALVREASIRRHADDLHDWPRPGDPAGNGA